MTNSKLKLASCKYVELMLYAKYVLTDQPKRTMLDNNVRT